MIALVSDIHGNLPALQAVLTEIEVSGCETIVSLGDVAGYYCQVDECIDLLREKDVRGIMGNHDWYMVHDQPCPRSNSANDMLRYQRAHITSDSLEWLRESVPAIECSGVSCVHGGWRDPLDEYVTVATEDYFKGRGARYFFSGHTHIQSLRMYGGLCHCNPGSVGQPRDHDPRAAFALFDGERIDLRRVRYDVDRIAAAMEGCGFGRYYYDGLYSGRGICAQKPETSEG
jgi:predicted phosphodiesterase